MSERPLTVLVAGGGVAALEALLALRKLAGERVRLELLSPGEWFVYRPLAVAEPFGLGESLRLPLSEVTAACGARRTAGELVSVDVDRRVALTSRHEELAYDALLVASGARPIEPIPGALCFRGSQDVPAFTRLLDDAREGRVRRLAFVVPGGIVWPLPAYELALLTAAHLDEGGASVVLVTPEPVPLALFGRPASTAIEEVLAERGVELVTRAYPSEFVDGRLCLVPSGAVTADAAVTLPRLEGPFIPGLPRDSDGFLPADAGGHVDGLEDVFAAGDVTTFPIKQGGIAAQQADAAAQSIAALAGAPVEPGCFEPVLRGLVLTGAIPRYLRRDLRGGRGETSAAGPDPLWWPPAKIAGRHLGPFLATCNLERESDRMDRAGAIAVDVEIAEPAVRES